MAIPKEESQIRQLIQKLKELPPYEAGKPNSFWDTILSDNFKLTVNLLMINEVIGCDAAIMTNEECRAKVGKLSAYRDLLLSPEDLINKVQTKEEKKEEDPLDHI